MKTFRNIFFLFILCAFMGACDGDTYLYVSNSEGGPELEFMVGQSSANLSIDCDKEWTISSSADWCKPSMNSGKKSQIVSISVDENTTGELRECVLTVKAEDESRTVRVVQLNYWN